MLACTCNKQASTLKLGRSILATYTLLVAFMMLTFFTVKDDGVVIRDGSLSCK